MEQKLSNAIESKKRTITIEAKLTSTQYAEFLALHDLLYIDRASIIRFSVLQQSYKIVINVRGIMDSLDKLGPAIADSGEAIARAAGELYRRNLLVDVGRLEELLAEHISLQNQLENRMRKLISLMSNN